MRHNIYTHPDNLEELVQMYGALYGHSIGGSQYLYVGQYEHEEYGTVDLEVVTDPNYNATEQGGKFRNVMIGETSGGFSE